MNNLVLIDGHSVLHRAFHAYPPLTTKTGELVNAVYGFTSILLAVMDVLTPTHIAICFDLAEPTFRHKAFEGYKASRPETPEELIAQQDRVREVVQVLNIPVFAIPGFEGDDVIGTLARAATEKMDNTAVVIVTGDRDALQLVSDSSQEKQNEGKGFVHVYMPGRGKKPARVWTTQEVSEEYGLAPKQLIDYKALAGDASDEIPGVRGIGPKMSIKLIQRFSNLDAIYSHLAEVRDEFGESTQKKLQEGKDSAYLSYKLGRIVTDVPLSLSLESCLVQDYDKEKAVEKFKELEFRSLIKRLPKDTFENMVQEELF